jgi:hypothetical protein
VTETEWRSCADPKAMLRAVYAGATPRRLTLFACGCCRRVWDRLAAEARQAVADAERWADGDADDDRLMATLEHAAVISAPITGLGEAQRQDLGQRRCSATTAAVGGLILEATGLLTAADPPDSPAALVRELARALRDVRRATRAGTAERATQAALVRCVFGNPFRPVAADPAWRTWDGGTIPRLARAAYEDRGSDRLPVLADALEEGGCTDAALLDHLRGPGPHVRGCWVVDLLTGRG